MTLALNTARALHVLDMSLVLWHLFLIKILHWIFMRNKGSSPHAMAEETEGRGTTQLAQDHTFSKR